MTPYSLGARISPYQHPHNIARSLSLAAVKEGVKRDAKGDTVLAQINPHEAAMLIAAGGSGRRDPQTGIIHFDPPGGSNAGGAGHASGGDGGGMGGGGNGGGYGGNQGSGGYTGTHASGPGYGQGPTGSPSGGGGQYGSHGGYMGGMNVNLGRTLDGIALGMIPGAGLGLSAANSVFGPGWGPSLNIGGTTNGYNISGDKTGTYGLGGWGNGPSNVGANVGSNNDGGWRGQMGGIGSSGAPAGGPAATVAAPAPTGPAVPPPAALPPGALPQQPFIPPMANPYMPWRQFMAYQNPANLGALPFALPGQPGA